MKIKEGASLQGLQYEMREVLIAADKAWKDNGQELVITSGTDGAHSAGSLHYYGRALDFRTRYFSEEAKAEALHALQVSLDDSLYDIVKHSTHIHVEYDPK